MSYNDDGDDMVYHSEKSSHDCHAQEYQGFYQQNVSILIDLNVTGGHM